MKILIPVPTMLMFINSNSWAETPKDLYNRHKEKSDRASDVFGNRDTCFYHVQRKITGSSPHRCSTSHSGSWLWHKPSQDIKIEEERQMFVISGNPLCEEEWERRYCI